MLVKRDYSVLSQPILLCLVYLEMQQLFNILILRISFWPRRWDSNPVPSSTSRNLDSRRILTVLHNPLNETTPSLIFRCLIFCSVKNLPNLDTLTTHYTLHTTHYTLHTTHNTLHITHYTLHTTHYTQHTTHYTLHTTHYTLLVLENNCSREQLFSRTVVREWVGLSGYCPEL